MATRICEIVENNMLNYNLIKPSKIKKTPKLFIFCMIIGQRDRKSNKCVAANISRFRKGFELKFSLCFVYILVKVLN